MGTVIMDISSWGSHQKKKSYTGNQSDTLKKAVPLHAMEVLGGEEV
jgi:hypothetical protein